MPARLMNKDTAPAERKAMAQRLNDLRIERHWTQTELSKRAGIQASVVTSLETGHVINPTADNILRLAKALNVRPEWLLDGNGEKFIPGPPEAPAVPDPVMIERVPIELAKALLKVIEEMQYARLYCEETLGVKHVERWLGLLLTQPELRSIGDHFMRAALDDDPTAVGSRPHLVVNNVGILPARTIESGVVLPKPDAQPVMHKVARLTRPVPAATAKAVAEIEAEAAAPVFKFSLHPQKGTKLSPIKKGGYTDMLIRKAKPLPVGAPLRQIDVCALMGIAPVTFWNMQKSDPDFPKPVEVDANGKAKGYRLKDFEHFLRLKLMEPKEKRAPNAAAL